MKTIQSPIKVDDSDLQADVEDELSWDPAVPAPSIGVSVTEHAVTLSGTVHFLAHRIAAVRAAQRVKGVHAIVDNIVVVPIGDHGRSDESIALNIERVLETNSMVPSGVKATVSDGMVTLTGKVDFQFQKVMAANAIRDTNGVTWVQNEITVESDAAERVVRSRIVQALHRNADVDARDIQVTADGHDVWLSGSVHSLAARTEAENAAWAAPGVRNVYNDIHVRWSPT